MTGKSDAQEPRSAPPAPTEYFHYITAAGDPRLYVMADADAPEPKERFFEEYNAYNGNHGARPRLVDPKYLPKKITLEKKCKVPPIFVTTRFVILDRAVRSAIEALEPDRHQFIPIKAFHRSGEEEQRDFFILNVHHVVEAMALEEMGVQHKTSLDGKPVLALPMRAFTKVKLQRAALDGAGHLFCDPRCTPPGSMRIISKEMVAAIKSAKGRLFDLSYCEVID